MNVECQHNDDSLVISQTSKCVGDLQIYASALSMHCHFLSDEVERMKSNQDFKLNQDIKSDQDFKLQIVEIVSKYELQLQENKSLHEQEIKGIMSNLRDSMEREELLKLERDNAIKIAEQIFEKTAKEIDSKNSAKLNDLEHKIRSYEAAVEELKVSKSETEFDLERATTSLDHIKFYFNHLLNSLVLLMKKRDDLILQKRILLRNLSGFSKLFKDVHTLAMACLDSTRDEDSLYRSLDGISFKTADTIYDSKYNHRVLNVMTLNTRKRTLPSLRVITIVILATIRFSRHEQILLDKLILNINSIPSLPPASNCKHMTSRMISDIILLCARE